MDSHTQTEIEAAVFRRLVEHFREHTEVQNIDVMNVAHFCRNCLSRWYSEAAAERGVVDLDLFGRRLGRCLEHAEHRRRRVGHLVVGLVDVVRGAFGDVLSA